MTIDVFDSRMATVGKLLIKLWSLLVNGRLLLETRLATKLSTLCSLSWSVRGSISLWRRWPQLPLSRSHQSGL